MAEREKPPRVVAPVLHPDGRRRCPWPGGDPLYVAYHDEEWGVPEWDDRALFEKLMLDGFQAGLSWITILRKRDGLPRRLRRLRARKDRALRSSQEVEALMHDAGIVRNRAKIEATIALARIYLDLGEQAAASRRHLVELRRRPADPERPAVDARRRRAENETVPGDRQGPAPARRQFRRPDDRLRLHAGDRHGQRPSVDCHRHAACAALARRWGDERPNLREAARLAAHAVGTPARPDRPLAARRRDRRHRAWARPRRALERPDQGRGNLFGRAAFACWWRRCSARWRRRPRKARGSPRCCTTRRNM